MIEWEATIEIAFCGPGPCSFLGAPVSGTISGDVVTLDFPSFDIDLQETTTWNADGSVGTYLPASSGSWSVDGKMFQFGTDNREPFPECHAYGCVAAGHITQWATVTEPGALSLVIVGLLVIACAAVQRKRSERQSVTPQPAMPLHGRVRRETAG